MVFEQDLEGFTGDLTVEEEVLVAGYEEDGSSAGFEIFQVTSLNGPVNAEFLRSESVVIYLYCRQPKIQRSGGRDVYLIPQLSWKPEEGENMRWHGVLTFNMLSINRHGACGGGVHGACSQFTRAFRVANQALPRSAICIVTIFT